MILEELVNDWLELQLLAEKVKEEHKLHFGYEISKEDVMLSIIYNYIKKQEK